MKKTSISGGSVLVSIAYTAVVIWFWVVHGDEYTAMIDSYIDGNEITNYLFDSVPSPFRELEIYLLYMTVPLVHSMKCLADIYEYLKQLGTKEVF